MNRRTLLGAVAALTAGTAGTGCLSGLSGRGSHVDVPCPTLSENADTLCTHTGADPDLALRPSSWRLDDGEGVSLTVTLSNDTGETARVSDYPFLKRRIDGGEPSEARGTTSEPRSDGGWEHVWPLVHPTLEKQFDSGETYAWKFLFYAEESTDDADETVALYALDPGTYALIVNAELPERTVQCVAAFEVGG